MHAVCLFQREKNSCVFHFRFAGVKRLAGVSLHQPLFIDVTASETGGEVVTNVPFEPQEMSQKRLPEV